MGPEPYYSADDNDIDQFFDILDLLRVGWRRSEALYKPFPLPINLVSERDCDTQMN